MYCTSERERERDTDTVYREESVYLEAKAELVAREDGRLPLEAFGVDAAALLRLGLLVLVEHRVVEADDVLPLVMLEELQRRTPEGTGQSAGHGTAVGKQAYVFMTSACVMDVFCAMSSMLSSRSGWLRSRSMIVSAQYAR